MDVHQNARTTRHGRWLMIQRPADGWTIAAVAAAVCFPQIGPVGAQFFGHVRPEGAGGAMKRKRSTEEQIAFAVRQAEAGAPVEEVCRKLGISEPTFHRWKKRFAGMGVPEIRRLKQLVADLTLDKTMSQDVVRRKW
jgi:putative transposase